MSGLGLHAMGMPLLESALLSIHQLLESTLFLSSIVCFRGEKDGGRRHLEDARTDEFCFIDLGLGEHLRA